MRDKLSLAGPPIPQGFLAIRRVASPCRDGLERAKTAAIEANPLRRETSRVRPNAAVVRLSANPRMSWGVGSITASGSDPASRLVSAAIEAKPKTDSNLLSLQALSTRNLDLERSKRTQSAGGRVALGESAGGAGRSNCERRVRRGGQWKRRGFWSKEANRAPGFGGLGRLWSILVDWLVSDARRMGGVGFGEDWMRILSGIQPSGALHIGNYFGAIRQYIELQERQRRLLLRRRLPRPDQRPRRRPSSAATSST